jgi:hypothetical protein
MPHASPNESFVWRAAARPERARLLGAIAIAISCGGLGVLVGRWSAPVAPATRTAALIQAVAKETRAKAPAADRATVDAAPAPPAAATPGDGQAASVPIAPSRAPARGQEDASHRHGSPRTQRGDASEPPLAVAPPAGDAPPAPAQANAPEALPGGRRSRHAATVEERPAAPNYQALRDYVLSR